MKIRHFTAPYEADAQMAFFVREGLADFAITEDSDLIAFGCPRVVLKLNNKGFGDLFDLEAFRKETDNTASSWDENLRTFQKMDEDNFIETCVMAGCEYIKSIDRVGLKVICKNFQKAKSCKRVVQDLLANPKFKDRVPAGYYDEVCKIKTIFKF